MTTIWKFLINDTEVDEPIGFDAVNITLQRDPQYTGLQNMFSDNLTFWGNGAQIIKEAYEADGIDAVLNFEVKYSCDGGLTSTQLINGILNCAFYSIINNEVTVKIDTSVFYRLLMNRLDTVVDLLSNTSVDFLPMSDIQPVTDFGLHSKYISAYSQLQIDPTDNVFVVDYTENSIIASSGGVGYPLLVGINEVNTTNSTESVPPWFDFPLFYSGDLLPPGITQRTIGLTGKLKGTITVNSDTGSVAPIFLRIKITGLDHTDIISDTILKEFVTLPGTGDSLNNGTYPFTIDFSQPPYSGEASYNFAAQQYMFLYFGMSGQSGHWSVTFTLNNEQDGASGFTINNNLKLSENSIYPPSQCAAFLLHEAFAKLVESLTGVPDSFRSNFFGQPNSQPHQYTIPGCGAWTALSNGLAIRRMVQQDGITAYPITTTFNTLFNSCNAIWNLGMRIESDGNNKEYVRIEPKEFFYNSSTIIKVLNVSDLTKSPSLDFLYNTFHIGYNTWNLNITGSNAIDEFNSDRNYTIPVKYANQNLDIMSDAIAAGYMIEQTRRIQYTVAPTNDFQTDNNIFIICANRTTINNTDPAYSLYLPPATLGVTYFAPGTVSERNENFSSVANVLSPDTCYNLRISPKRMAYNWYNVLSTCIWKKPTSAMALAAFTGNGQEADTMINDCVAAALADQHSNLLASEIPNTAPLYLPEYLEFTYPLSENDYFKIISNKEKAIGVSCTDGNQYVGFLVSLDYLPAAQGGIGSFKLIRGVCSPGDFNSDFSSDFTINNC